MTLTACGTTSTDSRLILPEVVTPSKVERAVMREQIPDFYVRFSEQQRQIMVAKKKLSE